MGCYCSCGPTWHLSCKIKTTYETKINLPRKIDLVESWSQLFFRLLVGFHPVWRNKRITILGVDWSFERAVVYKTDEGFVEAELQTLLQTYIHMNTEFRTYRHPLVKSFYLAGSK